MKARLLWAVAAIAVCITLIPVQSAFALTGGDVKNEFSNAELRRLFVETDNYDNCQFVMHDFRSGSDSYLVIRDEYKSRFDDLVGADSTDIFSEDAPVPYSELEGRPLEEITNVNDEPWCDLLFLSCLKSEDGIEFASKGSAFMVGSTVAVTAAHCVYSEGGFVWSFQGQSGYRNQGYSYPVINVSKAVLQKEWIDALKEGKHEDYSHDFALLLFDTVPLGTSKEGLFSCESISMVDSISMAVNNAGYASKDGVDRAWTNAENGEIPTLSMLVPGGNVFRMDLSIIAGMSGGPVFYKKGSSYVAVGINSYEKGFFNTNYACRITERLLVLTEWAEQQGYEHISGSDESIGSGTSPGTGGAIKDQRSAFKESLEAKQNIKVCDIPDALAEARKQNPDVCGWVCVPGTNVNLPIAHRENDNDFYLTHNASSKVDSLGCPFLDGTNASDFNDDVSLVYAHSFSDANVMFTGLHDLMDFETFKASRKIYLFLPDEIRTYRIASVNEFSDVNLLDAIDFSSSSSVQAYFDAMVTPNPLNGYAIYGESAKAGKDKLLQLSTCTLPAREGSRYVVTGILD